VYYDTTVCREVLEQPVCSAVQIVASDYLVAGSEQTGNDIESAHTRGHDECAVRIHDLCEVTFEVRSCRIAGPCVVILAAAGRRRLLLEGCGLYMSATSALSNVLCSGQNGGNHTW